MSDEQDPNQKIPPRSEQTTALSLLDQANGMNDFPVLKAFQEYIEAEQTRSRKRMLGLSVFFVVLLVVVVVTFSVIMAAVISRDQQNMTAITARNQELSDKLLDIALRERAAPTPQPVVNVQPATPQPAPQTPAQESMLKPLIEKIENLASALSTGNRQPAQSASAPAAPQSAESPETIRLRDELRRQKEVVEAIRAEREKLKIEQELKLERERLHKEQVELHRRRLYPDHYAREDALKAAEAAGGSATLPSVPATPSRPAAPSPSRASTPVPQQPVRADGIRSVLPSTPAVQTPPKPAEKTEEVEKPKMEAKPVDLKTAKPLSYFRESEAPASPTAIQSAPAPVPQQEKTTAPAPKAPATAPKQLGPQPTATNQPAGKKAVESPKPVEVKKPAEATTAKTQPDENTKTETLNVSSKEGGTIPFLIELPAGK